MAWEKEKRLVSDGQGTRNWTEEQQRSIIEFGVAYDEETGRAFEGQHMKSVGRYPEYADDPNNIQFLTRKEHLAAHDGNWQNPTNWYFDPITKEKTIFDDELIDIPVIELTAPLYLPETEEDTEEIDEDEEDSEEDEEPEIVESPIINQNTYIKEKPKTLFGRMKQKAKELLEDAKEFLGDAKEYLDDNPEIKKAIKTAGKAFIFEVAKEEAKHIYHSVDRKITGNQIPSTRQYESDYQDETEISQSNVMDEQFVDEAVNPAQERDYPEERKSPIEHEVSGYYRTIHTKDGDIKRYVSGYTRGSRKEKEDDNTNKD